MSLILKDIVKAFKDDVVLDGVSLSVDRGETLVLFGPSGAGKTVLLRLIAGVIEPDAGTIILQDRDMNGVEPEDRGIGMAFQNFALFPHMEAKDNIAAPLTARKMSKTAIAETVGKIARMLKIDHVLGHKPKELSNGQKQRTALGRAMRTSSGSPARASLLKHSSRSAGGATTTGSQRSVGSSIAAQLTNWARSPTKVLHCTTPSRRSPTSWLANQ